MGILDYVFGYSVERSAPRMHLPEQAMWTVRTDFAQAPPAPRETHKTRMARLIARRQERNAR